MQFFALQSPVLEPRSIVKSSLPEGEVTLDDGYVLKIKLSLGGVNQVLGQIGPKGEPVYTMNLSWNFTTIAPVRPSGSRPAKRRVRKSIQK